MIVVLINVNVLNNLKIVLRKMCGLLVNRLGLVRVNLIIWLVV